MTEMIERVARAMFDASNEHPTTWEDEAQEIKTTYLIMARAAIEAMREPTEAMESAGWEQMPDQPDDWSPVSAYERMIDAALK